MLGLFDMGCGRCEECVDLEENFGKQCRDFMQVIQVYKFISIRHDAKFIEFTLEYNT